MQRLEGKVAVVSGGSGGIGGAISRLFAEEGAAILIADLLDGEPLASKIRSGGGRAAFQATDVMEANQVEAAMRRAVSLYGRIDLLVNSHGWSKIEMAVKISEADFDRTVGVHLRGTFLMCKYAIREMLKTGGGAIVNLSSMQALAALPGRVAYEAAKGGISAMTRELAVEYGPLGIRVNALCPGVIMSEKLVKANENATPEEMQRRIESYPLRRLGVPEDAARAALFLASDDASWITGVNLPVDGGMTVQVCEALAYPPFKRFWDDLIHPA